jgi:cytochrome b
MDEKQATQDRIRVWDAPTRAFHWLLAGSFAGAWLLSETERYRNLHVGFGYAVAVLVGLRVLWGFVGTRHARFTDFVAGPRAAIGYVLDLLRGRAPRHAGHNPAGGLAILAILLLAVATAASGWLTSNEIGGEAAEELHEVFASAWLGMVVLHLVGVLVGSFAHRENLPRTMITGWKRGLPSDGIPRTYAPRAVFVAVAALAAFAWGAGFWTDVAPGAAAETAMAATVDRPDDDD